MLLGKVIAKRTPFVSSRILFQSVTLGRQCFGHDAWPLTLIVCLIILFLACTSTPVRAGQTVRVGVYQNRPLVFMDQEGRVQGLYADLIEYVAAKEGWRVEYVPATWRECLNNLYQGRIDLLTAVASSPSRKEIFDFSEQLVLTEWGQIYTGVNTCISSVVDFKGRKIAALKDDIFYTAAKEWIESFGVTCQFEEVDSLHKVLESVERGEVDAGVVNWSFGVQYEDEYKVMRTSLLFSPVGLRFAAPKDRAEDLLSVIDRHLTRLKSEPNSIYYQSLSSWLNNKPRASLMPDWVDWAVSGVGLAAISLLLLSIWLRKQVSRRTAELLNKNYELQQEIAEREVMEKALRESENRFRDLFDNISDFIFTHDMDGKILSVNRAGAQTLGYPSERIVGRQITDFLLPGLDEKLHKDYLEDIQQRGYREGVAVARTVSGEKRYIEFHNYLVSNEGQDPYVSVSGRDITERRAAEEELRRLQNSLAQSQKMEAVGTLAGGIAHDFNNILQVIAGLVDKAQFAASKGGNQREALAQVDGQIQRASELVKQLLTFGRKAETRVSPINLNQVFLEAAKLLSHTIPKMISIVWRLSPDLYMVKADPTQIQQILMNMAGNAVDAMPEGGQLTIESANVCGLHEELGRRKCVVFMVTDDGVGMDRHTQERIFEPFFTTKEVGKGTGLGLSTVYGIVQRHGGWITCRSQPGEGTKFEIVLPAWSQDNDQVVDETEEPKPIKGGDETLLVVDDEQAIVQAASEILSGHGYKVLIAHSGEEALQVFSTHPGKVDMVVMDLGMPGMGGLKCLERLVEMDPDVKVLVATGYATQRQAVLTHSQGAMGFLTKPYRMPELLERIRAILDQ